MPRLTRIEKLARDICWAENRLDHKNARATKASFWDDLDTAAQGRYVAGAEWLVFICQELKPLRVLQFVDYPRQPKRTRQ